MLVTEIDAVDSKLSISRHWKNIRNFENRMQTHFQQNNKYI